MTKTLKSILNAGILSASALIGGLEAKSELADNPLIYSPRFEQRMYENYAFNIVHYSVPKRKEEKYEDEKKTKSSKISIGKLNYASGELSNSDRAALISYSMRIHTGSSGSGYSGTMDATGAAVNYSGVGKGGYSASISASSGSYANLSTSFATGDYSSSDKPVSLSFEPLKASSSVSIDKSN